MTLLSTKRCWILVLASLVASSLHFAILSNEFSRLLFAPKSATSLSSKPDDAGNKTQNTTGLPFHFAASNQRHRDAIDAYVEKIGRAKGEAKQCDRSKHKKIDLSLAYSCLNRTTPSLRLEYPEDAEEHFNEIRRAMAPWAQHTAHNKMRYAKYSGPWIENEWITYFESLYDNKTDGTCLWDHFGPFIPLFIPIHDHWIRNRYHYPEGLLETLLSVLRPDVPYITVSQNDEGLTGKDELDMRTIPNVLVLSAGGYGHVPVPLFKGEEKPVNYVAVEDRTYDATYVGKLQHAPKGMRITMHEHFLTHNESFKYKQHYGDGWRHVMADSRFSLVPRGYGRTAYHLIEALQMGLVPIYIYSDVPWIPYRLDLFEELGFVTHIDEVDALIETLKTMTTSEIEERERRILSLRESHFSLSGAMAHIQQFLLGDGDGDLRCQRLPDTMRGV